MVPIDIHKARATITSEDGPTRPASAHNIRMVIIKALGISLGNLNVYGVSIAHSRNLYPQMKSIQAGNTYVCCDR